MHDLGAVNVIKAVDTHTHLVHHICAAQTAASKRLLRKRFVLCFTVSRSEGSPPGVFTWSPNPPIQALWSTATCVVAGDVKLLPRQRRRSGGELLGNTLGSINKPYSGRSSTLENEEDCEIYGVARVRV